MNTVTPTSPPPPLDPFQGFTLGWIRFAEFQGRSSRMEYWSFSIINFFIGLLLSFLFVIPGVIFQVVVFVPSISVWVRRLHDIGRSGWWVSGGVGTILAVPLVGALSDATPLLALSILLAVGVNIALFIMCFVDSAPETNQYGPNPKLNPTNPNHPV